MIMIETLVEYEDERKRISLPFDPGFITDIKFFDEQYFTANYICKVRDLNVQSLFISGQITNDEIYLNAYVNLQGNYDKKLRNYADKDGVIEFEMTFSEKQEQKRLALKLLKHLLAKVK